MVACSEVYLILCSDDPNSSFLCLVLCFWFSEMSLAYATNIGCRFFLMIGFVDILFLHVTIVTKLKFNEK